MYWYPWTARNPGGEFIGLSSDLALDVALLLREAFPKFRVYARYDECRDKILCQATNLESTPFFLTVTAEIAGHREDFSVMIKDMLFRSWMRCQTCGVKVQLSTVCSLCRREM